MSNKQQAIELIEQVHEFVLTVGYVKDADPDQGRLQLSKATGRDGSPEDKAVMDHVFWKLGYDGSDQSHLFSVADVLAIYEELGLIIVRRALGTPDKARQVVSAQERDARQEAIENAEANLETAQQRLAKVRGDENDHRES